MTNIAELTKDLEYFKNHLKTGLYFYSAYYKNYSYQSFPENILKDPVCNIAGTFLKDMLVKKSYDARCFKRHFTNKESKNTVFHYVIIIDSESNNPVIIDPTYHQFLTTQEHRVSPILPKSEILIERTEDIQKKSQQLAEILENLINNQDNDFESEMMLKLGENYFENIKNIWDLSRYNEIKTFSKNYLWDSGHPAHNDEEEATKKAFINLV